MLVYKLSQMSNIIILKKVNKNRKEVEDQKENKNK